MRERRTEPAHAVPDTETEAVGADAAPQVRYTAAGPLPPVMHDTHTTAPTASERAYGPLSAGGRVMEHEAQVDGSAVAEASHRYGIPEADILAVIT